MEPNIPLLRKVVEWVEWQDGLYEGKEWYQGTWFRKTYLVEETEWCDSAMCIAGKIVTDAGWVQARHDSNMVVKGFDKGFVWDVAAELLGLPSEVADRLFEGDNDASAIRRIAEEIAGERL